MWVPQHFRSKSDAWTAEIIDHNPFAILVSNVSGVPTATHVPVILEPEDITKASHGLEGVRILGHLARSNQQWESTPEGNEVLLIVNGPNAYVSPTSYSDEPAAPTWNYTAVHVTGPVRWIHDREENMRIIDLTIDRTEKNHGTDWNREPSREYFEQILPAVVGFEISVSHEESIFKLSQDEPPHRRKEVLDSLEAEQEVSLCAWSRRANSE